jgi:hypothetical protein
MRRQHRHRLAQPRHRTALACAIIVGGTTPGFDHAVEHAVARARAPRDSDRPAHSGDCGSATSSAASASDSRFGSLPK